MWHGVRVHVCVCACVKSPGFAFHAKSYECVWCLQERKRGLCSGVCLGKGVGLEFTSPPPSPSPAFPTCAWSPSPKSASQRVGKLVDTDELLVDKDVHKHTCTCPQATHVLLEAGGCEGTPTWEGQEFLRASVPPTTRALVSGKSWVLCPLWGRRKVSDD